VCCGEVVEEEAEEGFRVWDKKQNEEVGVCE
jgi:hypothetical protein